MRFGVTGPKKWNISQQYDRFSMLARSCLLTQPLSLRESQACLCVAFIQGKERHLPVLARTADCMSQRERKEKERKKGRKSQQALFGNNGDLISIFAVEDPHLGAREYPREPYTSAATTVVLPATAPRKFPEN